jgi:putative transposase
VGRQPRICFEGACYHIINRGNYRRDIFAGGKTSAAFEKCIFETCALFGWRLHAYVVMRNHFHLVVETPRANLVEGVHWLQSTFAKRFNRFRREHGHLFQGRYQALLIEPGPSLLRVVNYVHLNPVRAGIVTVPRLRDFRWSSYRHFLLRTRPSALVCDRWLAELGLSDIPKAWCAYEAVLQAIALDPKEQAAERNRLLSKGWAIGDGQWCRRMARDHRAMFRLYARYGDRSIQEAHWHEQLMILLEKSGRDIVQAAREAKAAAWKIEIAQQLRQTSTATLPWIAHQLHMGSARSLSVYLCQWRKINI